jgi:DNA repair protein RadC
MKTHEPIISEVSLIYSTKVKASERAQIKCSKDAFEIFMNSWSLDTIEHVEEFKLLLLNRSKKVLGISSLSKGGTAGTVVDVKLLLQYFVKCNANAIIICLNHPSGYLQPSESDLKLTQKVKEAAILMDVSLLDHLILISKNSSVISRTPQRRK